MRRRSRRGLADLLTAMALIIAAATAAAAVSRWDARALEGQARVADGDTVVLGGERVRLRGIDAPEHDQICTDDAGIEHACGRLAAEHLASLIEARSVVCEGHEADRFGRLLVICRASGYEKDLNARMVEDGWAVSYGSYRGAERAARAAERGIWAWSFEMPADWRRGRTEIRSMLGITSLERRVRGAIGVGGHLE